MNFNLSSHFNCFIGANISKKWQTSSVGKSASLLSRRDRGKIFLVMILQISFGLLDLLGIALIGILGALSIRGIQSEGPGNKVNSILEIMHLSNLTLQAQIAILGSLAVILLIGKTIFSIVFTKRILFFLSRRGAKISANLVTKLLSQSILTVQSRSVMEQIYGITTGVTTITVGILGSIVNLVSDLSLLLIIAIGLFFVDVSIAVATLSVFAIIGYLLYLVLHVKARKLGEKNAEMNISSNEKIVEVLNSYRESLVKNRRSYYVHLIRDQRLKLADINAELAFMPNISKYVIELTVVISSLLISALLFRNYDAARAVGVLSVFLAASTRIAPAVLRIQQSALQIRGNIGVAKPTIDLIESLGIGEFFEEKIDSVKFEHLGFESNVKLQKVSFAYPQKVGKVISEASIQFDQGQIIALVGPSGAGKTTLVDLMLGVLIPDEGSITISGLIPAQAISTWPGSIGYVPQDVMISNGTIKDNVALGYPANEVQDEDVLRALETAQLLEFIGELPNGINTKTGDRGTRLSGGQRQRLGIARAMFTRPKLLILDEATSSLDGETEANITESVQKMRGEVTVVMIAHRLSTVRHADLVVYMESGKVVATGNFDEVRKLVPNFDKQAQLMGL